MLIECKSEQIFNTLAALCEIDFAQKIWICGWIAANGKDKETHGQMESIHKGECVNGRGGTGYSW